VPLTAYCNVCERSLYIEKEDTLVCPVCSTPLLEVVAHTHDDEAPEDDPPQAEGRK
jgi:uncharacterized Zn finger protein (UPF0148 family)